MKPTPHRLSHMAAGAVVCALVSLVAHATAQQSAPQPALPDVQTLGPHVGSRVPDFTLLDQSGQSRTLASLMGPKGLMLVFYRSADWCPYCKTQLAELQTRTADLAKSGIGLAAVSYDAVHPRRRFEALSHYVSALVLCDWSLGRGGGTSQDTGEVSGQACDPQWERPRIPSDSLGIG